ncbi:hypothetical protein N7481_004217 [Penicillium waksmanii]|uniref:uncharacterized protein n=1 Tax=Penicillium waksmanii TaxID=69791 RepID=UPI002546B273|nr:uncharacterized protein N7481_004217 [Penicillium waksmanii]KAJ5989007.1 hypothetical protein N7481_004217 [Penicillium waksmanii]
MPAESDTQAQVELAYRNKPFLTGYLGPTSFVSSLCDDVDLSSDGRSVGMKSPPRVLPSFWVQKVSDLLLALTDFAPIEAVIREYYGLSQASVIPGPFILNSLAPIEDMTKGLLSAHKAGESRSLLTTKVIQNTAKIFEVPSSVAGKDFHSLYTDQAIRLEILGVICSLAGRAAYLGLAGENFNSEQQRLQFSKKMLIASDAALHICKILTPLNDLTIWLVQENLFFCLAADGNSSPQTWNKLGELSTDIFALGLHRNSKNPTQTPEFLLESRRRTFAAAYRVDKSIATFLGRPPRIPARYADCGLPLDVSDEAFSTDNGTLSYSLDQLDINGWSTCGFFYPASWMRARSIICGFRDEILEVALQKDTPETAATLLGISKRCHASWNKIPAHLKYTPQCWEMNLPIATPIMLVVSYLAYLYNEFLVHQFLVGKQNPRASCALLSVSSDILSTVLIIGTRRDHAVDLRPDFTWLILLYGIPSASILVKALQNQNRSGEPLLYEGSRPALIRSLSVFISHLDSVAQPDNSNYSLLQRASQVFTKIIDEILEPQASLPQNELDDLGLLDCNQLIDMSDLDLLNTIEIGVSFDQWLI